MLARYLLSSLVCLSVCLSDKSRCSTKMAKLKIMQTAPHGGQGTPWCKKLRKIYMKLWQYYPKFSTKAPNAGGVGKNCVFRPVAKCQAQMPYRRKFASIRHSGLRPQRCAGGEICGVINSVDGRGSLLITITAHLTSTTSIYRDSPTGPKFGELWSRNGWEGLASFFPPKFSHFAK